MEIHESQPHTPAAHPLMTALGRGLPITLLVDLIDPNGPRSAEMYERERPVFVDIREPRTSCSAAGQIA
jgi:hypothetical protein